MWAWQKLFPETLPNEEVETMKISRWWEFTKPKLTVIDTDVCITCSPSLTEAQTPDKPQVETRTRDGVQPQGNTHTLTEVQTPDKPQDETRTLDGLQPQGNTQHQDETKLKAKSDGEKPSKWIITREKMPPTCKDHNCMLSDLTEIPKATFGNIVVQLEMFEPTETVLEKAKTDLRETPEIMDDSITVLKELLEEEKDKKGLVVPVDNVPWLKRFLRPTHYYPKSAFEKVQNYYKFKDNNFYLYDGLKPSKEKNLFFHNIMTVLPLRDKEGRRILVVRIGKHWDYKKCTLDEIYKGAVLFLESAMLEPETQISGAVIIFDMAGLSYWQIIHFTANPSFVFRVVRLLQTAAPIRVKGLHIVNQSDAFGTVLKLFTNLLSDKFIKRIKIHGENHAAMAEIIGPDSLPPEYGGTCDVPLITGLEWYEALSILDEEYEAVNSFGYKKGIK